MKITLVNPPITATNLKRLPQLQPPLGLGYIGACLRRDGHEVRAVDGTGQALGRFTPFVDGYYVHGLPINEIVEQIDPDTDVIGVGIMFSNFWPLSKQLTHAIRRRFPHTPIVCGGEHVSACTELVMRDAAVDYAVIGEGEETIAELVDHLGGALSAKPLEQIDGVAHRAAGGALVINRQRRRRRTLDQIPWPAWDLFPVQAYMEARVFASMPLNGHQRPMVMLATRGCPYTCKFCSSENMWGTNFFMRSARDVVDEMESYMHRYGANDFHFQDLTMVINRGWVQQLCEEIRARRLNITWKTTAGTRSEVLDLELLAAMQQSGCDEILLAPESGSRRINGITRKRVNLDRVLEVVRTIRDHRLPVSVTGLMIVGYPEERLRDVLATYRYLFAMVRNGFWSVYINSFTAYPGSEYYEIAVREGRIDHSDDYFLNLERNFGLLNSGASWHPRWSGRQIFALRAIGYLVFFASYYLLHPRNIARSVRNVLRNAPVTRFERFFAFRLWQPLQRMKRYRPAAAAAEVDA
jgi:radical SAM superfamily enzyme YgiQ (UPF0313 family)